ncbi:MAG TPA: POTRA domain-containing protein [Polyangiaceae bacterium]|jgi:outer membrane protein insertion porin family/translocation and assembly module TamA
MKWFVLAILISCTACTRIPRGQTAVDAVDVVGNHAIDDGDLESKLATAPTPKFMGLFRGVVYDYSVYDRYTLAYDLARVERYYRARGYYEAHARAGRVEATGANHVRVEIVVDEGDPVRIDRVDWRLENALPATDDAAMKRVVRRAFARGVILDEDALDAAKKRIALTLANRGYAKAHVDVHADADLASHRAVVTVEVRPAEKCVIGAIRIVGLGKLPEPAVRRAIGLDPGEPFSRTRLDEAQNRLLAMGVVSSATIDPELDGAPFGVAPLVARLEPAHLHEVHFGGGIELDVLKTDVHLRAGWRDLNFLGDLRRFSVDFTPGVVLYPTRLSYLGAPTDLLPEEKLRLELRQPGFIERHTDAFIRPELNTYPVIIRETYVPGEPVLGYLEIKSTQGLERGWMDDKIRATLSHTIQIEWPFAYKGTLDPSLVTLAISYVELMTTFDFRNSKVHPRSGVYLSNDLQVAGLGGQPQDVRIQPEVRGYLPLGRRVTIAARASVGFDFPFDYGVGTDTRDVQIVFFRGFFSGGPSENRGYPPRGIGPQGDVALYNPLVNSCLSGTTPQCFVPLGGLSLWEASLETRVKVAGPFEAVGFCDAADVSAQELALHLDRPHLSCGLGARYDTPVGPVRADVGYRIPGAQVLSGTQEYVPDLIPGVPITISVALGEAF